MATVKASPHSDTATKRTSVIPRKGREKLQSVLTAYERTVARMKAVPFAAVGDTCSRPIRVAAIAT